MAIRRAALVRRKEIGMPRISQIVLVAASLAAVPVDAATACHATSAPLARPLIELYTSEGCDSCPPADRWLASHFGAGAAPSPAIALAFHVDYWDRLGWIDRFAKAEYTARQYAAMHANGASFVYTPQILLQGHDFADWRSAGTTPIDEAAHANAGATIALDAAPGAGDVVVHAVARIVDGGQASDAALFVAYADSGLVSEVEAGENRGRQLRHDHVVRALRRAAPSAADGRIEATLTLPAPAERGRHPQIVAFVQRERSGDVLQALALPLDDCIGN
jgi:hypothetical protein